MSAERNAILAGMIFLNLRVGEISSRKPEPPQPTSRSENVIYFPERDKVVFPDSGLSPENFLLPISEEEVPSLSQWEKKAYQVINELRKQENLPPLTLSETLIDVAQKRSFDMATKNYFAHYGPGKDVFTLLNEKNPRFLYCYRGENLFRTNLPVEEVFVWPDLPSGSFVFNAHDGYLQGTNTKLELEPFRELIEGPTTKPFGKERIKTNLEKTIGLTFVFRQKDQEGKFKIFGAVRMNPEEVEEFDQKLDNLSEFFAPLAIPEDSFILRICSAVQPGEKSKSSEFFPAKYLFILQYSPPSSFP